MNKENEELKKLWKELKDISFKDPVVYNAFTAAKINNFSSERLAINIALYKIQQVEDLTNQLLSELENSTHPIILHINES